MNDKQKAAEFFYEQCSGGYSGHMAVIPHNPSIHAFVHAFCHPVVDRENFAKLMREWADALDKSHKEKSHIPF